MTHYRLTPIRQGEIALEEGESEGLKGSVAAGSGRAHAAEEIALDQLIELFNEHFGAMGLSEEDCLHWIKGIEEKVRNDQSLMDQVKNNAEDQVMYSDYPEKINQYALETHNANQIITMHFLNSPDLNRALSRTIYQRVRAST
mgnify:CR=1 FL=1